MPAADLLLGTGPFAVERLPLMLVVGIQLIVVELLAAALSLTLWWRRATGVEWLQLKWLVLAVNAGGRRSERRRLLPPLWLNLASAIGHLTIPAAVAIAVLRYRLYEIDRMISRGVAYAVVTAVLVGLYALVAVVPSVVLALESDLLVAAATLAAAASSCRFDGGCRNLWTAVSTCRATTRPEWSTASASGYATTLDLDGLRESFRNAVRHGSRTPGKLTRPEGGR
jgi:hypothetical protein